MSADAIGHREAVLTTVPTLLLPSVKGVAARLRHAAAIGDDVLVLGAIVFSIPFVILAIGLPIALFVQLLLWIGRLF